jgi:hypothetical protein
MSFEEFFNKKKINLELFEKEEPELLLKLRREYEALGPKSFDYEKKFWFNRWRLKYKM